MEPRIETLKEKHFTGKRAVMSFSENRTSDLWRSFMSRRKEINEARGPELYSIEVYKPGFFDDFDAGAKFEKWAAVETTADRTVPDGMETIIIPVGLYAVFIHSGPPSDGPRTYEFIFRTWLPGSGFILDNRPHFAVMGEKYKGEDPASEEELWIPIRRRNDTGPS